MLDPRSVYTPTKRRSEKIDGTQCSNANKCSRKVCAPCVRIGHLYRRRSTALCECVRAILLFFFLYLERLVDLQIMQVIFETRVCLLA